MSIETTVMGVLLLRLAGDARPLADLVATLQALAGDVTALLAAPVKGGGEVVVTRHELRPDGRYAVVNVLANGTEIDASEAP